jgi:glucokinase
MILAGDIGGTHARLAFFDTSNGRLKLLEEKQYPSREYVGLGQIVSTFIQQSPQPVDAACFGIAGPVREGRAQVSNLPWGPVDSRGLAREINISSTFLINDLEASAWGLSVLDSVDMVPLKEGSPNPIGNQAVIAAGTGLGEAGRLWDGKQHQVFPCEGGHTDFGPRTSLQIELLQYLIAKFGRVSYERVLSGPGLANIYYFLRDTAHGEEPAWLRDKLATEDPAAVVSEAALEGKSPLCEQALDLFVSIYGAEAGNLALKIFATGGVFISGGIAPKILPKLISPNFIEAFVSKGRMRSMMETIPVHVVVNENAGLLGAARCAVVRASQILQQT